MISTRTPAQSALSTLFCLLAIALTGAALVACTASEETMKGASGEFCMEDQDCRTGLTCENNACSHANPLVGDACTQICGRLDSCDVSPTNCTNVCIGTIEQWSEASIDTFEQCFLEDKTCEELQDENVEPAQLCYDELPPIPDERRERCDGFERAASSCRATDDGLDQLTRECPIMARTRSDEVWAHTDECEDRVQDGVCIDIFDCLNEVMDLDPALEEGGNGTTNGTGGGTEPTNNRESTNDREPSNGTDLNDEFNGSSD